MKLENVILRNTTVNKPAATTVPVGTIFYDTTLSTTSRSNGTTWDDISDASSTGITQLTGDVTAGPGSGSQVATVAATHSGSAHHAQSHDHSAAGDGQTLSPATLNIPNSVAPAPTAEGQVAWDSDDNIITMGDGATTKHFPPSEAMSGDATQATTGALTIATAAVTYAKMQDVSAISKLLGRGSAAGAGDVEEITLGANLTMTGTTLAASGGGAGGSETAHPFLLMGA